jgi:hypothetical protein
VVFEPAIPAYERPQTHALDSAATGIGLYLVFNYAKKVTNCSLKNTVSFGYFVQSRLRQNVLTNSVSSFRTVRKTKKENANINDAVLYRIPKRH